jgi:hypothetical protein
MNKGCHEEAAPLQNATSSTANIRLAVDSKWLHCLALQGKLVQFNAFTVISQ